MKASHAKRYLPLALCAVLLTRCSCDFFGTTGALLISENDESKLGLEFDKQLHDSTATYPVYVANTPDRIAFDNYVQSIAHEILVAIPKADKPGYEFKITIIDKDVENAFAVPGGYVYIYTGIIKKMRNESELTGVLGHEIAHVTQHHYRDAMAKDAALSLILQALLGNDAGQLTQLIASNFATLAQLKVSRDNESEADFYGTKYTGAVGRNPLGIATLFSRFDAGGPPSWLSTHPAPVNRVADVQAEVDGSATLKALAADSARTDFTANFDLNTKALPKN
ncbi:MAG: peptidase family [Fibrobacteres bacterium]|nr:peptidase family [Fibrobacterota bacterium]